jgi:hypothetical protein
MVDTKELVNQGKSEKSLKLAAVSGINENGTAMVTFYGESEQSQKGYCYISYYKPVQGDLVLMIPFGETYIIAGKVQLASDIPLDYITAEELQAAVQDFLKESDLTPILADYALKTMLDAYSKTNHNHREIVDSYGYTVGLNLIVSGYPCLVPSVSNISIGYTGDYRFKDIYAINGTINTSDRREKNTIKPISDKYVELFKLLKPVTYKFNNGESGRIHIGYISNDIEKAMQKVGMDSTEFAGFIKTPKITKKGKVKGYDYGLRYDEFIALNTYMIQALIKRIDKLEKRGE